MTRVAIQFANINQWKHTTSSSYGLVTFHVISGHIGRWRHHVPRVTHPVVTRVTSELVKLCAKKSKIVWHVESPGAATCPVWTCHVRTVRPATWQYSLPSQHQIFCLFDFSDRTRYLLHMDFAWRSKYTAGIRKTRRTQWHHFHRIPSTLNFEQILDPWSRFWSHLPTKRILDSQKLMIINLRFKTPLLSSYINWFYLKRLFDNHLGTLTCPALQLTMSLNHCSLAAADPLFSLHLEDCQPSHWESSPSFELIWRQQSALQWLQIFLRHLVTSQGNHQSWKWIIQDWKK